VSEIQRHNTRVIGRAEWIGFGVTLADQKGQAMVANDAALVGTWRLDGWESRAEDGRVNYPFGSGAIGLLTYTADGFMFGALMRANRSPFVGGDLFEGTPEEWTAAGRGYVTYCGRYEISGDAVIHHVEMCLFPNWIGRDQVRFMALDGDRLTLTTGPIAAGGQTVNCLTWTRAPVAVGPEVPRESFIS